MRVFAWPAQRDELREIFNDISSSSEDEEDEGDRHEDEDLNIMDTEDDLVRQLQDKLNESDSAQHESDRNNQIGESLDRNNLFGFSSAGWTKKSNFLFVCGNVISIFHYFLSFTDWMMNW